MTERTKLRLSHLDSLEAEAIHILREVVATFENPVLLYSVGKDSSVLVRLAQKAFFPGPIPFPLLHVDTSYKFPEMIEFRDRFCQKIGADLRVFSHRTALEAGTDPWSLGTTACCALLKTQALLMALQEGTHDAAIGGARRDEEKSRAKERVYSFRDRFGQWEPRGQRPELWNLLNGRHHPGESVRVFPLSNWTELDVWLYILREKIPVVPLYLACERPMVVRGSQLIPAASGTPLLPGEEPELVLCRFRTLGCSPCTGAVRSQADTLEKVVEEIAGTSFSERITRLIDHDQTASMERKKREGYF